MNIKPEECVVVKERKPRKRANKNATSMNVEMDENGRIKISIDTESIESLNSLFDFLSKVNLQIPDAVIFPPPIR